MLTKLEVLDLHSTQIKCAGCAALVSALDRGTLPALKTVNLEDIPGGMLAYQSLFERTKTALANSRGKLWVEVATFIGRHLELERHVVHRLINVFLVVAVVLIIWLLIDFQPLN